MTKFSMIGSRELRRVPADFDCPIGTTWTGWFNPDGPLKCSGCGGDGYSPTAQWLYTTFYEHNTPPGKHWGDKLLQHEVDALAEQGVFRTFIGRSLPTDRHPHGINQWMRLYPSAEEVNAVQRGGHFLHDLQVNVYTVVPIRCKALGAELECSTCNGEGVIYRNAEHRAACDAWNPEPPTGDHIQIWQTVSEGGPVSPVFPDTIEGRHQLAMWMENNDTSVTSNLTAADWLRVMDGAMFLTDIHTGKPEFAISSSKAGEDA